MSIDYAALTNVAAAGLPDVRCCAMISHDGLVLGCSPAAEEERATAAWRRLAMLGEVERGFLALRDELWVVCRRGPYAAVAVASPSARPGLVLDQLEQALLTAEEARMRREGVRTATEREASTPDVPRGIRSSLHREALPPADREPPSDSAATVTSAWRRLLQRPGGGAPPGPAASDPSTAQGRGRLVHLRAEEGANDVPAEAGVEVADPDEAAFGAPAAVDGPVDPAPASPQGQERGGGVDRVEISREFAGLLQELPEERAE